jgi:hypothetical protein
MSEPRTEIDPATLLRFLKRAIEKTPQDCRNRFARRIEALGGGSIAIIIAAEMQRAGWVITAPRRDPGAAIVGPAYPQPPRDRGEP